jgi:hypothetical protein
VELIPKDDYYYYYYYYYLVNLLKQPLQLKRKDPVNLEFLLPLSQFDYFDSVKQEVYNSVVDIAEDSGNESKGNSVKEEEGNENFVEEREEDNRKVDKFGNEDGAFDEDSTLDKGKARSVVVAAVAVAEDEILHQFLRSNFDPETAAAEVADSSLDSKYL